MPGSTYGKIFRMISTGRPDFDSLVRVAVSTPVFFCFVLCIILYSHVRGVEKVVIPGG